MTSPVASGVATTGPATTIDPGHPFYPAIGGSTTFTITCTDGVSNATDSAVVNVVTQSSGGGGSSSGGSSSGSSVPPVNTGAACLFVKDYMRADFNNNPQEVLKLQAFLKVFQGYDVALTGIYDQATINAVNAFQLKYRSDILDPWGLTGPTSYTYILTLKKVNELYCLGTFPLNEAQAQEIIAFRELITGLRAQGIDVQFPANGGGSVLVPVTRTRVETIGGSIGSTTASTTTITIPVVGLSTTTDSKGQNTDTTSKLASVLFAAPKNLMDTLQCIYEFLLILIVLYFIACLLEDVLYKKEDLTAMKKRFFTKWATIATGLVIAGILAYIWNEYCLILPLLIALILSLIWMALYPKHNTIKDPKAWIPVIPFTKKTVTTTTTTETKV
jgi:hypothetical protein